MEVSVIDIIALSVCPLLLVIFMLGSRKAYYCPQCHKKMSQDAEACLHSGNDLRVRFPG